MRRPERFIYLFANRRSDRPGIEQLFAFEPAEVAAIKNRLESIPAELSKTLQGAGIGQATAEFLKAEPTQSHTGHFAHWIAATAIALQRTTGHDVSRITLIDSTKAGRHRTWFESEHSDVGLQAARLALRFVSDLIPELDPPQDLVSPDQDIASLWARFAEFSTARVLPQDAQSILDACARLDIPCVKLDRAPYEGISGDFRIRNNGLLKLGHAGHTHVVDGTLCIDKSPVGSPLLHDRDAQFRTLKQLNMPVAAQNPDFRNLRTVSRAVRAAEKLTYPVVVKPMTRGHGSAITLNINSSEELTAAVQRAQRHDRRVIVEKHISGETYKLIIAGTLLSAVLNAAGEDVTSKAHPTLHELCSRLTSALEFGMAVLTVVSTDISKPLAESGAAIVDLDIAPQLESLLAPGSAASNLAVERFVRWIYPEHSVSRIPIISITGTNGKTTTTRMVAQIMQAAGYRTGMALTDGVYINGQVTHDADLAGVPGHLYVFESTEIDCAVLETAMGSLATTGLMFDWCNVAACTNISLDHIGSGGINNLQQLADLKRTSLERARDAVIINADDPMCLAMVPGLQAGAICLTSTQQSVSELQALESASNCFCVLEGPVEEDIEGQDGKDQPWIVLYQDGKRTGICAVGDIPATLDGQAEFNISNAQIAIASAWLAGVAKDIIRQSMCTFEMSFDGTPGRLNIYDELPFRIIMDYAHNPGGMVALSKLISSMEHSGRTAILFAAPGDRKDLEIAELARATAGYYDHYYVRSYPNLRGRQPGEVGKLLEQALLDSGVPPERITALPKPELAVEQVLGEAGPGDLVVITAGKKEFAPNWEKFRQFEKTMGSE